MQINLLLWIVAFVPYHRSLVGYAPDAVKGDEFDGPLCRNLHPPLLQLYDFVSRNLRAIAWSPPVNILHLSQVEVETGIVPQTQEMNSAGSHFPKSYF